MILNTCHIREKASEKVYSELGRLRVVKDEAARQGRDDAASRSPAASRRPRAPRSSAARRRSMSWSARRAIIICRSCWRAPKAMAARWRPNSRSRTSSAFCAPPKPDAIRARGISSFVTVQEGCDKFCTFCVVPYTRGAEVSRPVAKIVDDVMRLADNGVREITLIGQNVNAYHGEGPDGRDLAARPAAASPRRNPRHRAAALLDQPSPRRRRFA